MNPDPPNPMPTDTNGTPPPEPVVLPDVATQPHPLPDPEATEPPIGDYVRELQQEFADQEEEGKI